MTDTPENSGTPDAPRVGERIAKLLARAGVASRREIERMIAEGRVRLNDQPLTTPATVLPDLRGVTVDGQPVKAPEATRLFLFHKPSGLITAERDPAGRPTIYSALRNALPPGAPRVMPVGRLDLNTEGLLLLTNDGELKRAMELPSSGVPRTYRARTFGDITQARLEELIEGVEIDGIRYGKIDANMERRTGRNQWIELTLTEGKNREVRRVLEHLGLQVSRLLRVAYGPFVLGDLPRGAAGEIAPAEVEKFRRTLGLAAQDPGTLRKTQRVQAAPKAEPEARRRAAPERGQRAGGKAAASDGKPSGKAMPRTRRVREDEGPLLGYDELRGWGRGDRSRSPDRRSRDSRGEGQHGEPPRREAQRVGSSRVASQRGSAATGSAVAPSGEGRGRQQSRGGKGDARSPSPHGSRPGGPRPGSGGPGKPRGRRP